MVCDHSVEKACAAILLKKHGKQTLYYRETDTAGTTPKDSWQAIGRAGEVSSRILKQRDGGRVAGQTSDTLSRGRKGERERERDSGKRLGRCERFNQKQERGKGRGREVPNYSTNQSDICGRGGGHGQMDPS